MRSLTALGKTLASFALATLLLCAALALSARNPTPRPPMPAVLAAPDLSHCDNLPTLPTLTPCDVGERPHNGHCDTVD